MIVATPNLGGSKLVGSDQNQLGRLIFFYMSIGLFRMIGLLAEVWSSHIIENFTKKVRNWVIYFKSVAHLDHVRSYGVREVVSLIPDRPGQYSRMSFSSDPGDWYGFLI